MISHIHNIHNLQKRFEELERTCTQGCKAAYRASQLVSAMKQGAQCPVHRKLTRHGELRIKNCKKFGSSGNSVLGLMDSHDSELEEFHIPEAVCLPFHCFDFVVCAFHGS